MSILLEFGNPVIDTYDEDGEVFIRIESPPVSGKYDWWVGKNKLQQSYSAWAGFKDRWLGVMGTLQPDVEGRCVMITEEDYLRFLHYQKSHNKIMTIDTAMEIVILLQSDHRRHGNLDLPDSAKDAFRLEFLVFWSRAALDHFDLPVLKYG